MVGLKENMCDVVHQNFIGLLTRLKLMGEKGLIEKLYTSIFDVRRDRKRLLLNRFVGVKNSGSVRTMELSCVEMKIIYRDQ